MKCKDLLILFVCVTFASALPHSHFPRMRGRRIPNPRQVFSNENKLSQGRSHDLLNSGARESNVEAHSSSKFSREQTDNRHDHPQHQRGVNELNSDISQISDASQRAGEQGHQNSSGGGIAFENPSLIPSGTGNLRLFNDDASTENFETNSDVRANETVDTDVGTISGLSSENQLKMSEENIQKYDSEQLPNDFNRLQHPAIKNIRGHSYYPINNPSQVNHQSIADSTNTDTQQPHYQQSYYNNISPQQPDLYRSSYLNQGFNHHSTFSNNQQGYPEQGYVQQTYTNQDYPESFQTAFLSRNRETMQDKASLTNQEQSATHHGPKNHVYHDSNIPVNPLSGESRARLMESNSYYQQNLNNPNIPQIYPHLSNSNYRPQRFPSSAQHGINYFSPHSNNIGNGDAISYNGGRQPGSFQPIIEQNSYYLPNEVASQEASSQQQPQTSNGLLSRNSQYRGSSPHMNSDQHLTGQSTQRQPYRVQSSNSGSRHSEIVINQQPSIQEQTHSTRNGINYINDPNVFPAGTIRDNDNNYNTNSLQEVGEVNHEQEGYQVSSQQDRLHQQVSDLNSRTLYIPSSDHSSGPIFTDTNDAQHQVPNQNLYQPNSNVRGHQVEYDQSSFGNLQPLRPYLPNSLSKNLLQPNAPGSQTERESLSNTPTENQKLEDGANDVLSQNDHTFVHSNLKANQSNVDSDVSCIEVNCPRLENCMNSTLVGCCPVCTQVACICQGYQRYDCEANGFQDGLVPEGESYSVDAGSTLCICPRGGGDIVCSYQSDSGAQQNVGAGQAIRLLCPPTPLQCIETYNREDGCVECVAVGCVDEDGQAIQVGTRVSKSQCRTCFCPEGGGELLCLVDDVCSEQARANESPSETSSAFESTQRVMRDPLSSIEQSSYSQEDVEKGYDTRLLQPDWNNIQPDQVLAQAEINSNGADSNQRQQTRVDQNERSNLRLEYYQPGYNRQEQMRTQVPSFMHNAYNNFYPQTYHPNLAPYSEEQGRIPHGYNPEEPTNNIPFNTENSIAPGNNLTQAQNQEPSEKLNKHQGDPKALRQDANPDDASPQYNDGYPPYHQTNQNYYNLGIPKTNQYYHQTGNFPQQQWRFPNQYPIPNFQNNFYNPYINPYYNAEGLGQNYLETNSSDQNSASVTRELIDEINNRSIVTNSTASFENVLSSCCNEGRQWAMERDACLSIPVSVSSYSQICAVAQEKCCRESQRHKRCESGIFRARRMSSCFVVGSVQDACMDDDFKICCDCCALGLKAFSLSLKCEMSILGERCNRAYTECCRTGRMSQPSNPTLTSALYPVDTSLPSSSEQGDFQSRCSELNCPQGCVENEGGVACQCLDGFRLGDDGRTCTDINECVLGTHDCTEGQFCLNLLGSFNCQRLISCGTGYELTEQNTCNDIDECALNLHDCDINLDCVNIRGSYRCVAKLCSVGYFTDATGGCIDINECRAGDFSCPINAQCQNTDGSYTCRCPDGFIFEVDENSCDDIDECVNSPCSEEETCINTEGSYTCRSLITLRCQAGYEPNQDQSFCIDINECLRGTHTCSNGSTCINDDGSFRCEDPILCPSGTHPSRDQRSCIDINECDSDVCGYGADCINSHGSYRCECISGYEKIEQQSEISLCRDIDECQLPEGSVCPYRCENNPGSFSCICPDGYIATNHGLACQDVDECLLDRDNCSASETCFNTRGSFKCVEIDCPEHYAKLSSRRCIRQPCRKSRDKKSCIRQPRYISFHNISATNEYAKDKALFKLGLPTSKPNDRIYLFLNEGNEEGLFRVIKKKQKKRNSAVVCTTQQLEGPRDFVIDLTVKLYRNRRWATFLSRLYIYVSAFDF